MGVEFKVQGLALLSEIRSRGRLHYNIDNMLQSCRGSAGFPGQHQEPQGSNDSEHFSSEKWERKGQEDPFPVALLGH